MPSHRKGLKCRPLGRGQRLSPRAKTLNLMESQNTKFLVWIFWCGCFSATPQQGEICVNFSVFRSVFGVKFVKNPIRIRRHLNPSPKFTLNFRRHPWQRRTGEKIHSTLLQDSCSEVVRFGFSDSNRQRGDGQRCEHPVFLVEGT